MRSVLSRYWGIWMSYWGSFLPLKHHPIDAIERGARHEANEVLHGRFSLRCGHWGRSRRWRCASNRQGKQASPC